MKQKTNVQAFNQDVLDQGGYQYSLGQSYSTTVANERLTAATLKRIGPGIRKVLDLGCGDGAYTGALAAALPHVHFVGIDAAQEAITTAKRRYPSVDFRVGDAHVLSTLPRERFDLAIARGVLHHLSEPQKAIQNLLALADEVLIIEPNGNNPILKVIEKVSPYHREHEEQSFSSLRLKRWCRKNGGEIKELDYVGFVPFFFPTIPARIIHAAQPLLEKIPLVRHFLSGQIVIVARSARA